MLKGMEERIPFFKAKLTLWTVSLHPRTCVGSTWSPQPRQKTHYNHRTSLRSVEWMGLSNQGNSLQHDKSIPWLKHRA